MAANDKELLQRINDRRAHVYKFDRDNRQRQRDDTNFVYTPGASWSATQRKARELAKDPCMEFPQLKQFVAQVVNDQRQSRPGVRIHPVSGDASEKVAKIIQGLIRGIEYDSNAEAVFDCGYQHSVVGGRGYWRVVSKYEKEDSFNQVLLIKRVADPLSVWLDADYQDPDGGDRQYAFIDEAMSTEEFKRKYPKNKPISTDVPESWRVDDDDMVIISDYYERTAVKRTLVAMSDGVVGYKDELPDELPDGVEITNEREVDTWRVDWYTVAGGEQILEAHEWPGSIIPVVCAMGDEIVVEGRRSFYGLISPAKDAQRLFDFGMTQQAVTLSSTSRSPYVAAAESIAGYEKIWNTANVSNYSVLPYNAVSADGSPLPAPSRASGSQPDAGWLNWTQQMTGLIRSTIGMYQNSLGMQGNETSGRAIQARERQSDNSTFHFQDNLSRAIALTGRIIVGAIPTFYDTERIVSIINPDDSKELTTVNQEMPNPDNPMEAIRKNDLTSGKYSVTVEAGPTYATKRQETADLMMGMVQAYPPLMQIAGDLVMKVQDVPDADLFAERLKLMLPPPILQSIAQKEQEKGGQKPMDPQVMAQMQQLQGQLQQAQEQMQQMGQALQQAQAGEQAKMAEAQAKVQAAQSDGQVKMQIAQMEARNDGEIALQRAQVDADTALKKAQIDARAKMQIALITRPTGEEMLATEASEQAVGAVMEAVQKLAVAAVSPRKMGVNVNSAGDPVSGISEVMQ